MKKLFLFFAALICIVAAQAQSPVTTAVADTTLKAKIVFANMDHDYGTINKGADGDCIFKFKNHRINWYLFYRVKCLMWLLIYAKTHKHSKNGLAPS